VRFPASSAKSSDDFRRRPHMSRPLLENTSMPPLSLAQKAAAHFSFALPARNKSACESTMPPMI
jgi:hypothetical protein